jgi:SNF2 family DNA or RNA helicase
VIRRLVGLCDQSNPQISTAGSRHIPDIAKSLQVPSDPKVSDRISERSYFHAQRLSFENILAFPLALQDNCQNSNNSQPVISAYHTKYFAYELTRRCPTDSVEKLAGALVDAQVDLNPHQVDAALFAFNSPLSKGALLADEVGLGKTIEAGLVLSRSGPSASGAS